MYEVVLFLFGAATVLSTLAATTRPMPNTDPFQG